MSSGNDLPDRIAGNVTVASFLDALKYDENGLVTVVAQDHRSREVLGVAFANRDAVHKTLTTGKVHYYSRSRKKLWLKGEESGHFQHLVELRADCDGDALLARVRQIKGNCHLGFRSCFSFKLSRARGGWKIKVTGRRVFDPEKVYSRKLKK